MRNHDKDKNLDHLLHSMPKPSLNHEKKFEIKQSLIEQNILYENKRTPISKLKRFSYGLASVATLAIFSLFLITFLNEGEKELKQNSTFQNPDREISVLEAEENPVQNEPQYFLNSGFQQFDADGNIVYFNKQIGFRLTNLGGGASNFEYEIDKTYDSGKTWAHQGTTRQSRVMGISFINETTGFLVNNSPAFEITPTLIVTQNGGKDWTEQQFPIPSNFKDFYREAKFPVFFTESIGVLPVFGFKNAEEISFLYMLISTDGGSTWEAVTDNQKDDINWITEDKKIMINYQNKQIEMN